MIKNGGFKIHCIDALFTSLRKFSCVYALIAPSGESAIIDTGTPSHYAELKASLASLGVTPDTLTSVFVSHMHMDHSGNASLIANDFPKARFFAHIDAVPHLVDPSVLIHQSKMFMPFSYDKEYGDNVTSVPRRRIVPTTDGDVIEFGGGCSLKVLATLGHDRAHISIFEPKSKTLFTGDSFGSRYPHINPQAVFASTSPSSFNPDEMIRSIHKMLKQNPKTLALSHFGMFHDVESHANKCIKWIEKMKEIAASGDNVKQKVLEEFKKIYGDKLSEFWTNLKVDVAANSCGVYYYSKKLNRQVAI